MILFKKYKSILIFPVIFLIVFTGVNNAYSNTNLKLKTSVVSQGGKPSQSTRFQVQDVIGQPSPVNSAASTHFQVFSGYINQIQGGGELPQLPDYWEFTDNTDNYANVVLPTDANPNIEGVALANGDYVGVFTPAGLCCGYRQWQGANLSLTVWGDDSQTSEVDGFRSGETINYRVYRLSEQKEWTTVQTDYSTGNGIYSANGFMVLSRFDVLGVSQMTLNFGEGWNMFSINVNPVNPNIATVMTPIIDKLVIVKNGDGKTFIPAYGINDIGNIDYTEGYQAYLNQATTLAVTGQAVSPTTPISLPAGWSMIGYLSQAPINIAAALASIGSQLVIAKNNEGKTYIPLYSINDIGDMQPGQGYQVYLNAAATLVYPASRSLQKVVGKTPDNAENEGLQKTLTEHFQFTKETGENMTVIVPVDCAPKSSDGTPLEIGDEIGVFTGDSLCCGAIVWVDSNRAITVWADNNQTDEIDGFSANDTLHYRVWKKTADMEYPAIVQYEPGNSPVYHTNSFVVLTELVADLTPTGITGNTEPALPSAFKLLQNHPNPFNPETTIMYQLPQAAEIALSIYDIQGREIRQLARGIYQAGYHTIIWNGRDYAGNTVASGIYFYRIEAKMTDSGKISYVDVKKMILMK